MKKKLFIIGGIFILVIAGIVFFLSKNLNIIVKSVKVKGDRLLFSKNITR